MPEQEVPIEIEWIETIASVDVVLTNTDKNPTSDDDWHIRIEGRVGDGTEETADDVEFAALPFLYAIGLLSFADARPRGYSEAEFLSTDEWNASDLLRHLRFVRGELRFYADYVRGRCMKTDATVRRDGTFVISTVNRGEAATRWLARLQGKKVLAAVRSE